MRKMPEAEKLELIKKWSSPDRPAAHALPLHMVILGIVDCPYGNTYHYRNFSPTQAGERRDVCPSCLRASIVDPAVADALDAVLAEWIQVRPSCKPGFPVDPRCTVVVGEMLTRLFDRLDDLEKARCHDGR